MVKGQDEEMANNEIVFGKNSILEALQNENLQINKLWISNSLEDHNFKNKIISFCKERKIQFYIVPVQKISSLTKTKHHQGLALNISPIKYLSVDDIVEAIRRDVSTLRIILVTHEIEDPHNLGALIRTFVAGGGKHVILTGRSNVGVNSTVIKTSAGALFQAEFARASNCSNVLNKLKEKGFWIVGTSNDDDAKSVYRANLPKEIAILVGNEHEGLGKLVKKNCDFLVRVPIDKKVDSLNVSVAFAIVFFEMLRQNSLSSC